MRGFVVALLLAVAPAYAGEDGPPSGLRAGVGIDYASSATFGDQGDSGPGGGGRAWLGFELVRGYARAMPLVSFDYARFSEGDAGRRVSGSMRSEPVGVRLAVGNWWLSPFVEAQVADGQVCPSGGCWRAASGERLAAGVHVGIDDWIAVEPFVAITGIDINGGSGWTSWGVAAAFAWPR